MDRLEKMKKPLAERFSELTSGGDEYVRAFALRVFNKADDDDRAGRACKKTALNFYSAFQFMDVLRQFGEFPDDLVERYKYAKFKAADINAALKAGRTPTPGPPGGLVSDEELPPAPLLMPDPISAIDHSLPQSPHSQVPCSPSPTVFVESPFPGGAAVPSSSAPPAAPLFRSTQQETLSPPATHSTSSFVAAFTTDVPKHAASPPHPQPPTPAAASPTGWTPSAVFAPSDKQVELANKHARIILSSLQFDDYANGIKYARMVIDDLTGGQNS
eukprot:TRINITY_DN1855_c0_g1_i3.p1 TRINITY_DN1855_c0_g1~~TRINITY_DN1855_c0_g1_i3.p1  ORF type:complete len:273 (-),score=44.78 TRINITY_DN1855_c0_g1_i3:635-1453(-)